MRRRSPRALLLCLLLPGVVTVAPAAAAVPERPGPDARVIVQGPAAEAAVVAAGGQVTASLPIVDGVAATVPAGAVSRLRSARGVRNVTADDAVRVQASAEQNATTVKHVLLDEIGATTLRARGLTGKGVRVALVDTGVSELPDLAGSVVPVQDAGDRSTVDGPRATVPCVDFSGEDSCADSYGHGTFMAGLIAGDGSQSGGLYSGVAPGAELVSIKIAGRDGSSDVSKLLAAIQWVVSFKDTYGIRVLNLSLGTDSTAPTTTDPLNYAVQRAWTSGVAVIVSAGNRGPHRAISKPGDDPLVLTVGSVDDRETTATSDDRVPAFSSRGPSAHGLAKPDVVAPGGRVISLGAPGSRVASLPTKMPAPYRRGSGTSMSAAVVSGLSALLLEAHPEWTPDQLKLALTSTAVPVNTTDRNAAGAGLVFGPAALAAAPVATTSSVLSDASGRLDDTRGTMRVTTDCGDSDAACELAGDETGREGALTGFRNDPYTGYTAPWDGTSWYSSQWVGLDGTSWYGTSWYGTSWYGTSWYGVDGSGGETDQEHYGRQLPGSASYGVWK